ncbi:MAG: ComEA family DNA-binding protein [Planctomycetota bacterium]|jgi:competence protein ComEA
MGIIRKVYFILVLVALVSFMGGLAGAEEKAKININTATAEELSTLKEIGEKKAASIIEYRENHGHFTKIEDIKNVKGIGDKIFAEIKGSITIE